MPTIAALLEAALAHQRAGRLAQAESLYRQVLGADPREVVAHSNLGIVLQLSGAWDEAEACFRQALALGPDSPPALNNLGTLLLLRGDTAGAQPLLERALQIKPDYAYAHNNLGSVWLKLGRYAEARGCFAQALAHQPSFAIAHYNMGTALHKDGRLGEAEAFLREALRLQPGYAPAHYQLGAVLKDDLRLDEARACLEEALRLEPDFVDALSLLANVLGLQGKTPEARAAIDRARAIRPGVGLEIRAALILPLIYGSADELQSERRRFAEALERLSAEVLALDDPLESVGSTPFYLAYQGMNDRDPLARLAAIQRRAAPELSFVAPHCHPAASPRSDPDRPIRVGFLSTFFHRHTIGKLNLGFVRNLSRRHFAVTLLRFPGPDDDLASALAQGADRVVTLTGRLDLARRQIADERLDILYYADIGMDPLTYYLAFARLAPVQCVAWGHPVTTGIPTIDYFLSSAALEPPDAAGHYTEGLVQFEKINTYYYEPRLEAPVKDRRALGLGDGTNLYVCTQSLFKVHPDFDAVLGQILRGDPRGRVVLIEGPCAHWKELLGARFRRSIPAEADRVDFLPRLSQGDFLHLQARADVLLDTTHFGGGSTSYEAFAFGTPIVTLAGSFLRDRITAACYRQMGLSDCIAATDDDYVRMALRLGTDPAWRDRVRARILARKHLLYEDPTAVRELESFFLRAVARARAPAT